MDRRIIYTDTKNKQHDILFYDLLESGHNMDKHIINGTLFRRPDHHFGMLVSLLKPDSIVYDVGSYIGTFSIPMAIEGMELHAFEGFPDNYSRCKKNTEPYNITNHLCAVSDKEYSAESKFNSCMDDGYEKKDHIHYFVLMILRPTTTANTRFSKSRYRGNGDNSSPGYDQPYRKYKTDMADWIPL